MTAAFGSCVLLFCIIILINSVRIKAINILLRVCNCIDDFLALLTALSLGSFFYNIIYIDRKVCPDSDGHKASEVSFIRLYFESLIPACFIWVVAGRRVPVMDTTSSHDLPTRTISTHRAQKSERYLDNRTTPHSSARALVIITF